MVALAASAAEIAGARQLQTRLGDIEALDFLDGEFDLVLALGVLPWVSGEARSLGGDGAGAQAGRLADRDRRQRGALARALNPRSTPPSAPLRRAARWLLRGRDPRARLSKRHRVAEVEGWVRAAGLVKIDSLSIGFGPFSLSGKSSSRRSGGVRVQLGLQRLARAPIFRATGAQYAVLAREPDHARSGLASGQKMHQARGAEERDMLEPGNRARGRAVRRGARG